MDLKICGGSYSLEEPVAIQETINMFPEIEKQGSQERIVLRRFPGLKSFVDLGSPIRGMKRMAKVLYAVAGTTLYSVDSSGTSTSIGTIAGSNRVSMATDGSNLVIVNGTATGYVYNGAVLSTITDDDFVASSKVYFLDTYFIHQRADSQQFFISESGSATSYLATDFASKESQPGKIVALFVAHRDVILLGEESTETWRNTGDPDFPFQRQEGTFQERGCLGVHTPAEMDNTSYFLGDDRVVYALRGYQPTRISHHAIEKWLSEQSISDIDAATGITITHQGHYWYILSLANGTWVYDSTTSNMKQEAEWFQLKSWNRANWRVEHTEVAYGETLCGDVNGVISKLDPTVFTELGEQQLKRRVSPYYHVGRSPTSFQRIELGFKQGVANGDVANPQVFLELSKDWGRTWSSRRARSMGRAGKYTQKGTWRRNGVARGHVFRFTVTDDVDVTFTGAYGEVGVGSG